MDASELETYQYQLSQVEEVLSLDPGNEDMIRLKKDLTDLIDLKPQDSLSSSGTTTKQRSSPSPATSIPSQPNLSPQSRGITPEGPKKSYRGSAIPGAEERATRLWKAGDRVVAKWKADGCWYPARVMSVGGSDASRIYSVQFQGYSTTEIVPQADTRVWEKSGRPSRSTSLSSSPVTTTDPRGEVKRKKTGNKRFGETVSKQKAWLAFASGGKGGGIKSSKPSSASSKLGSKKPNILNRTSMFASNPDGKVGVVGSGKPMTQFVERGKHRFPSSSSSPSSSSNGGRTM
ncbi:MAG: hypothetical protein DHS80DRAFT_13241 [Piptocephalis tieghemiana]|nr:MAG: hypothetical protein DHS80DRAFT_13241 [Piptocephalis tieghemiana]